MRLSWVFVLFALRGFAAVPDISECDDSFSECQEDCTMQYGSKTDGKKKFGRCVVKCQKKQNDCREAHLETKRNGLEEGSIAKSPSSRKSDEDDLRHDAEPQPKPAEADDDEKPKKKKKSGDDEPKKQADDGDTVKSTRTRVSDAPAPKDDPPPKKSEPPAEAKKDDPPPKKQDDPPARAEEPKSKSGLDSDVRAEDEKKKSDDKPKSETKKRKALDEWDPEAL